MRPTAPLLPPLEPSVEMTLNLLLMSIVSAFHDCSDLKLSAGRRESASADRTPKIKLKA